MGQNPVNPRPDLPGQPQSGPSGPSAPNFGQPGGPGYGYQSPVPPPQGPQSPMSSPSYPMPGQGPEQPAFGQPGPVQPAPFGRPGPSPYGSLPGPGQPGPGPSYPYAGGPGQAYPTPGVPPLGRAPKKKGKGLVIGLIAGAVALVLVAVAVVAVLLTSKATPASTEPDKATKSTAALQGYLQALAAGDADKAKLYAIDAPADSPFLTNDFLKAAVAKSPITEIQVDAQSDVGTAAYLSASYKLGGTLVQGNYQLTKVAKIWKLNSVITTVDRPSYWGTLGVTVNGTTAPTSQLSFFPGVYQLGTGTSLLAFAQPAFTVNEPGDYVAGLSSSEPALTDAGKKLMISKAQAWLTVCLAAQDTNPKDCGMNTPLPTGATLAPGSLKRTLDSTTTPFSDATPRASYDDPKKITMTSYVSIKITAADTAGNTYSGSASVSSEEGTIDGENITVVFVD
jgi:hypothetical protein